MYEEKWVILVKAVFSKIVLNPFSLNVEADISHQWKLMYLMTTSAHRNIWLVMIRKCTVFFHRLGVKLL